MTNIPQETPEPIENAAAVVPTETEGAQHLPALIPADFEGFQLHLFQTFLSNTDNHRDQLSNAIDLWDCVPRYSISRQEMTKLRVNGEFLRECKIRFQHRGRTYTCVVHPARVTDLDGKKRDFYPSASEELVEDALRKLAVEQQAGFHDRLHKRSGVMFSLYALRKEMEKRGHARSYQQIVQSLNILSHSVVDILPESDEGESIITSACLPSLAAVSRKKLKDDPEAKWSVQFHPLVTGAIDQVTHRQYNYHLMMSHDTQLARWLHKQLVLKFTFADMTRPFQMRYSTIKRDSGLLYGYGRDRAAIKAVESAFAELNDRGLVRNVTRTNETGPRKKLLDVVFTIRSTYEFVKETKASNKRLLIAKEPPARR